jgi:hypothetical protein
LGSTLHGFIFEQEYQRQKERTPPAEMARALDSFFEAIPKDDRYHVELRTESYLCKPVFDVLAKHGVGRCSPTGPGFRRCPSSFPKRGQGFSKMKKQEEVSGKEITRFGDEKGVRGSKMGLKIPQSGEELGNLHR